MWNQWFGVIKKPFVGFIWERTGNYWFIIAEIRKINSLLHCKLPYIIKEIKMQNIFLSTSENSSVSICSLCLLHHGVLVPLIPLCLATCIIYDFNIRDIKDNSTHYSPYCRYKDVSENLCYSAYRPWATVWVTMLDTN